MNIVIITDYDKITDYNNIDIIIQALSLTIPGLSFLCLISFMVYTLIKPLSLI